MITDGHCLNCNGTGHLHPPESGLCRECGGTGAKEPAIVRGYGRTWTGPEVEELAKRYHSEMATVRSVLRSLIDALPRAQCHAKGGHGPATVRCTEEVASNAERAWFDTVDVCDECANDPHLESPRGLPWAGAVRHARELLK